jgi:hypothetical protein
MTKKAREFHGADPKLPFYITGDLFLDGSVDIASEGKDPMSLEYALEHAKGLVEECGGTMYVIECRVVQKITRGRVRVESIKTKPKRPPVTTGHGGSADR